MTVSMITARSLSALPGLIVAQCGEDRLTAVCERAGLPASLPQNLHREFYFPQLSLLRFVVAAGQELGTSCLGLMAAHQVTVRDYGIWADYILAAPTLRACFKRAVTVFFTHSTGDTFKCLPCDGGMDIQYRTAVADARGYENISHIGLGVIESVVKHYAGQSWRPDCVTLDYSAIHRRDHVEEMLGSRVCFGGDHVSFFVPDQILDLPNPDTQPSCLVTASDVIRVRRGRSPVTFAESVRAVIQMSVLEQVPGLDSVATEFGIGLRTLQRRLDDEGTSFRKIVEEATMEQAVELLREPDICITRIATALGYSSPSHFSRAFRRRIGASPTAYRETAACKR